MAEPTLKDVLAAIARLEKGQAELVTDQAELRAEMKDGFASVEKQLGGQRALLFDAVALGILRGALIQLLGLSGARGVLTRFGYCKASS